MATKYRAVFYIRDRAGYQWAESTTPLFSTKQRADDNARQYADYVNTKTHRTVTGYAIKAVN